MGTYKFTVPMVVKGGALQSIERLYCAFLKAKGSESLSQHVVKDYESRCMSLSSNDPGLKDVADPTPFLRSKQAKS